MEIIKKYLTTIKMLLGVFLLIGSFSFGFYLNGNIWEAKYEHTKAEHAEYVSTLNKQYAEESRKALDQYISLQSAIEQFDKNRTQESNEFKHKLEGLATDYRDGTKRLSVLVQRSSTSSLSSDKTSNNPSLGNGAETAYLDRTVASGLTRLTGEGDKAIIQLNACQDILGAITKQDDKALSDALQRAQSISK